MQEIPELAYEQSKENVVGKRVGAALFDLLLLGVVFVVMAFVFGGAGTEETRTATSHSTRATLNLTGLPFVLYVAIVFSYHIVLEAAFGQSLGKMAFD